MWFAPYIATPKFLLCSILPIAKFQARNILITLERGKMLLYKFWDSNILYGSILYWLSDLNNILFNYMFVSFSFEMRIRIPVKFKNFYSMLDQSWVHQNY